MLYILQTALELGFLSAHIPIALFLSFRIFTIAVMTRDDWVGRGTSVSVTMTVAGNTFIAIQS